MTLRTGVDHLVVAAATLDEGVAWCRETLGVEPSAGGEHPLMGTHNRVLRIDSPDFERAYFEIIAINPQAQAPGRARWFDLDDAAMREAIAQGPRLIHFVSRTNDVEAAVAALATQGIDRGKPIAASRGALHWTITVRDDGQRLFDGVLPTLIEWPGAHPCDSLPASGVSLQSVAASHPQAQSLQAAYDAIGPTQVRVQTGDANLIAVLATPKGQVRLESALSPS
jgi:catechol 2,3-dioxygenase-like lactoylglutathione lyase family enzyme